MGSPDPYDIVLAVGQLLNRAPGREPLGYDSTPLNHCKFSSLGISRTMDRMFKLPLGALLLLSCALNVSAHGGGEHAQVEVLPDADWATRHMAGTKSPEFSQYET